MPTLPTVSIVVAAYNAERYIGRCIRSLLKQRMNRDDYEIIVVNDGSTDRTSFALDLFAGEIVLINSAKNEGLPASLNKALKVARGRYAIRVDADDYVSYDYVYFMWRFIELNPEWDAAACDYQLVNEQEQLISHRNCEEHPIGCGIIFRMDQLIDIGLYDPGFLIHEDRELRIRFEKKYRIHRVQLPLYRYRQHEASITRNKKRMTAFDKKLRAKHPESHHSKSSHD